VRVNGIIVERRYSMLPGKFLTVLLLYLG